MAKFRERLAEVEAHRWTGELVDFEPIYDMTKECLNPIGVRGDRLVIYDAGGTSDVLPGQWVVVGTDNKVRAYSPEAFVAAFQPMEG
jgi:hypothetical protein